MHIAILTGGISSERDVAIRSAMNMKDWIRIAGHTSETFDFPSDIHRFLQRHQASTLARHFPTKKLKNHLESHQNFDLVIPMFHGIYGEDGQVTAFLDTLGYTYAYSPFAVHSLCLDKYQTNLFVAEMRVKIPETYFIPQGEPDKIANSLIYLNAFPYIVKPNRGGSSIATNKVKNEAELSQACSLITDDDILIQECIEGREFTVGVYLDSDGYHSLPIIEIRTLSQDFFDYVEKYETDGSNEVFLEGEDDLQEELRGMSVAITKMLHCRGVVRIDYRYDGNDIYFLEVNTIPGFTSASLIPKMWKKVGKNEKEFVEMLQY
ncbi:ATP-grasp domain-containing protein [Candidatus Gracilibacteria bacterium]|nr:ATP-grasp domain-containing protein [Candidatus Gracilibacteria bacterium]